MEEVIARGNISLHRRAGSWEEAIRVAAAPLEECGSIEASYTNRMIESVKRLGPYMVIMPGLALAHAAPGADVRMSDLSIAVFDADVRFHCDNDPVRIVMCLACTNREAHLARLQRMAEKLMDAAFVDRMRACESADELYGLLNE